MKNSDSSMIKQNVYKNMKKSVIKLLSIHGISGQEKLVRDYLINVLPNLVDDMVIDSVGNILAEKKCGNGKGAVVMLSAHMDTVKGVLADRELIIVNDTIRSNKGVLGADDRSGIAIILSVLKSISTTDFNGTLKIAFSVSEEIGCVGSSKMDKDFYKDVNLAIVIDRRGNSDIVVGCYNAFCSSSVGYFLEDVSDSIGANWECVEGGISDAVTFSGNGINSVNLSCGYLNEHTDREELHILDMYKTYDYIMAIMEKIDYGYVFFEEVPNYNDWVKPMNNKYNTKYNNSKDFYSYLDNPFIDDNYNNYGLNYVVKEDYPNELFDVHFEKVDDIVYIMQGGTEIAIKYKNIDNFIATLKCL